MVIKVDHAELEIRCSKTDQYRHGSSVVVAHTRSATCPVAMLECYVAMAGINLKDDIQLLRPIIKTKRGEELRKEGKLSYIRMRELMREKLQEIGLNVDSYMSCIVSGQGVQQQQRTEASLIEPLRSMADGSPRLPKMRMCRTHCSID